MHPPLLPLQPSSFLVIHRFTLFNFLLLLLILFLLCSQFGLSCHSSSFLLSSISSISVFSSAEPFVFSCNTSFHPLQLSSLVSNPLLLCNLIGFFNLFTLCILHIILCNLLLE